MAELRDQDAWDREIEREEQGRMELRGIANNWDAIGEFVNELRED